MQLSLRDRYAGSVCEVDTTRPVFHLTFDDGPHPEVTPRILDVLEDFIAPATFFLLTDHARLHPDVVAETLRRGHQVGLHGRTHRRLSNARSKAVLEEVVRARRELERLAGRPVELFRPPYGDHGLRSWAAATRAGGMKTVLWSVDSYDWQGLPADTPLGETTGRLGPGGIALVHDTPVGRSAADERVKGHIAKERLTERLLAGLRAKGMAPVSLIELLNSGPEIRRFHPPA